MVAGSGGSTRQVQMPYQAAPACRGRLVFYREALVTDAEALAILQRTQFEQENFGYTIAADNKSSVKLSIKVGTESVFFGSSLSEAFAKARAQHAIPRIRPSILIKLLGAVTHDDRNIFVSKSISEIVTRVVGFAHFHIHGSWIVIARPGMLTLASVNSGKTFSITNGNFKASDIYLEFAAELAAAPLSEIAAALERWDGILPWLNGLAAEGASRKDPEVETEEDREAKKMIYARLTALKLT